jgi:hypothetical protein
MKLDRFPTNSGALYFGPLPDAKVLKTLKTAGIDAIWNLASELKLIVPYEKLYVKEVIFGNINDLGIPTDSSFVSQLDRVVSLLKKGKKVFVHCFGGIGRTSTALAAIKVALEGIEASKALAIAEKYAKGPETFEQDEYVEKPDKLYNGRAIPPKKQRIQQTTMPFEYEKLWQEMLNRQNKQKIENFFKDKALEEQAPAKNTDKK